MIFEDSDRQIIKELLSGGMKPYAVAGKWDCDPTSLYRQLRCWRLDTKGNDVKGYKPLDAKRKRIIEFIDIRQHQTDIKEIALGTGFSWEFVKEFVIERKIKLLGKNKGYESERKREVLLVNHFRSEGFGLQMALLKAKVKQSTYSKWCRKLGLKYKKAPK